MQVIVRLIRILQLKHPAQPFDRPSFPISICYFGIA
ncbi:Protein of unknown function [Pyronema omphalodes CBS 100304]|uniref:Uncharacterized protein n=1 Tax=Pyronema omphalodes (strain CBS 100304) TaxID=1076935 RepID=U4L1W7_PYROM|nr:Protein of unknown function [Pyronema omphalodes CBS 100304]